MSAHEHTGVRDLALSNRHRLYGFDCPATDIDFLLLEYNHGQPIALIEHKHKNALVNLNDSSIVATKNLADRAQLPFFIVRYNPDNWHYIAIPGNRYATSHVVAPTLLMEEEYISLLYKMRGGTVPQYVLDAIKEVQAC
jgi:hypothetical protein